MALQAGVPVATGCFAVGAACVAIGLRALGAPLIVAGGLVTAWIVWKLWREQQARRVVRRLFAGALRRLDHFAESAQAVDADAAVTVLQRERAWVQAAFGEAEGILFLDMTRHTFMGGDPVLNAIKGARLNLTELNRRAWAIDLETDFEPDDWTELY
jgi:hypothetical protein